MKLKLQTNIILFNIIMLLLFTDYRNNNIQPELLVYFDNYQVDISMYSCVLLHYLYSLLLFDCFSMLLRITVILINVNHVLKKVSLMCTLTNKSWIVATSL